MNLKRNIDCQPNYFPDGLGGCQSCEICLLLSTPPRGCETCEFGTTTSAAVRTTYARVKSTQISQTTPADVNTQPVQRISRTTETMGYRTIITGQSYLSGIQWAPLALVGLAVIVLLILVAMALRRKTYQLPSFNRGEENASNHSPVQTRVEFDYITGKSQTSIHTPTQSKLPEIQIPSAEKKNSFCCVDAKLKYASTFYQEHYLNRHCHSCLRLIDDHSPRCSTIVTVNCSPCVHVNIDKYPFK